MRRALCVTLLALISVVFPAARAATVTAVSAPEKAVLVSFLVPQATTAPSSPDRHQRHLEHLAHLSADHAQPAVLTDLVSPAGFPSYGTYSFTMLERVWVWAGGPAWAAPTMARIAAQCESGGRTWAANPSGASGLWQILGTPFPGNPFDGPTNARMAVAKFVSAGDSYGPWAGDGCV